MYEINNVVEVRLPYGNLGYRGTLRNETKFNIDDNVFLGTSDKIIRAVIVGVEKTTSENPDYIYTLEVTGYGASNSFKSSAKCDRIFRTLEDAKKSVYENLELQYSIKLKELDRYFAQFEKD